MVQPFWKTAGHFLTKTCLYDPEICFLESSTKRNENMATEKNLYKNIFSSFIHKSQKS